MILSAIRQKLAQRGPLGFARDAAELALACTVVGVYQLALAGGAVAGVVVALPLAAWECATKPRGGERPHACNADCAAHRTPCGGGK